MEQLIIKGSYVFEQKPPPGTPVNKPQNLGLNRRPVFRDIVSPHKTIRGLN